MNQAEERSSTVSAAPSAGNVDDISGRSTGNYVDLSPRSPRFGDRPLGEIERNDVYYALSMIDARAMALRMMLEVVKSSRDIDDNVRGLLDVIAFEVAAIEDLADERMREGAVH